jgi:hypothetical protein
MVIFLIVDSESDWGQSQGFDTAIEGREEGETSADLFPKKIKVLETKLWGAALTFAITRWR